MAELAEAIVEEERLILLLKGHYDLRSNWLIAAWVTLDLIDQTVQEDIFPAMCYNMKPLLPHNILKHKHV